MNTEEAFKILHPIYQNGKNYGIPEHWLAGLIAVEEENLNPKAFRFEPDVFHAIYLAKEGMRSQFFPGFYNTKTPLGRFIKNTNDWQVLRSLATSYGVGQIMGYNYFGMGVMPQEYTNLTLEESVRLTLQRMGAVLTEAEKADPADPYGALLRIWNTGRPNGQTYNPDYVPKAKAAASQYESLLKSNA